MEHRAKVCRRGRAEGNSGGGARWWVPGDGCAVAPSGCISCTHVQTQYLHMTTATVHVTYPLSLCCRLV